MNGGQFELADTTFLANEGSMTMQQINLSIVFGSFEVNSANGFSINDTPVTFLNSSTQFNTGSFGIIIE